MAWKFRRDGSPKTQDLPLEQIASGLRDGVIELTDEVQGPGETAWQSIENHPQFAELAEELEAPPVRHEEATSLDMNALIDVCLVLLIFFILTTSYATLVQKVVPLPGVKASEKKGVRYVKADEVRKQMIRVQASLDQAGKPVVRVDNTSVDVLTADGSTIDPAKVTSALVGIVRNDGKAEVLLDAREISWGMVIAIQDGAKAAGVHSIHHLLRR